MQALSRKNGEQITILGFITLQFELPGGRVKVGIEAPKACRVMRKEVDESGEPVNENADLEELYELDSLLHEVRQNIKERIDNKLKSMGNVP